MLIYIYDISYHISYILMGTYLCKYFIDFVSYSFHWGSNKDWDEVETNVSTGKKVTLAISLE